jgi:hypothetical protein
MRGTFRFGLVLALLLITFSLWPVVELYRLARAIETRDLETVSRHVDWAAVRISVTRQVIDSYLQLTGRDNRIGRLGRDIAIDAGVAVMQPAIAEATSSERLLKLLAEGWPKAAFPTGSYGRIDLTSGGLAGLWALYLGSEWRLRDFVVLVPVSVPAKDRFGLGLRLVQWRWKLYRIQLPEELRIRLAKELIKATDKNGGRTPSPPR